MPSVTVRRLHHLAITVTDLDARVRWYESVFDVHHLMDARTPAASAGSSPTPTSR